MAELLQDKRFAHIGRDPRFREMKKQHHKVKIDKRFKGMFNDKRFKVKYMVDKRGRPVQTSSSDHLRRYYHLSSSEEEGTSGSEEEDEAGRDEEGKEPDKKKKDKQDHRKLKLKDVDRKKNVKDMDGKKKTKTKRRNAQDELSDESEDDECVTTGEAKKSKARKDVQKQQKKSGTKNISISSSSTKSRAKHVTNKDIDNDEEESSEGSSEDDEVDKNDSSEEESNQDVVGKTPDFARGEGLVDSDNDSEESESEPEIDHDWAELDKDAPEAEAITRRLAVCNMDWDRIKAIDLLVLFNSFKPPDGVIHSVIIYPSDFGLARMKEEETRGPVELVTHTKAEDGEETEYNTERLRQYQLKRLKYYYAIVECDTPETASAVYDNCDGTEYESSAAKLDLRYIPDDMTFEQEVKSVARDIPSNYTPSLFVTTALQQSNVELTWDETSKDRIAVTMRRFNKDELDEMDLNDYLASDDDDDAPDPYGDLLEQPTFGEEEGGGEEKEEEAVRKYKALLQGLQADDRRKEDKGVEMEVSWGLGLKETTQDLVKKAQKEELTPWETYLEKRKEKNRAKREQKMKTPDTPMEETAAFSDDELPEGDGDEDFFTDSLSAGKEKKKRTKKKKKKPTKLTAEEEMKQKEDKAELSLLMMDEDDEREHFSLKEIQEKEKMTKRGRRRKRQVEEEAATVRDTFQMDLSDNRFEAVFTNPLYNIDPSSHEFKKTKAIENLIDEKVKRVRRDGKSTVKSRQERTEKTRVGGEDKRQTKPPRSDSLQTTDALKLESLIKSVKVKTKLLQDKKKKKLK